MLEKEEPIRVHAESCFEVQDDILDRLVQQNECEDVFRGVESSTDCPFEMGVARPQAYDVRQLHSIIDPMTTAQANSALGPKKPVLISHSVTPFYRPNVTPTGIWGMGYEVTLHDIDASTISVFPASQMDEVARLRQDISIGLNVGGTLALTERSLDVLNEIPGLQMRGARITASSDQTFRICITMNWSTIHVQSGPVDCGGAKWNIYRTKERIDVTQTLLHTLLIPDNIISVDVTVRTWIRCPRRVFFWNKPYQWTFPEKMFTLSLE